MADATVTEDRPRQAGGTSTREDRLLSIDTPLGKDKLVLTELSGEGFLLSTLIFGGAITVDVVGGILLIARQLFRSLTLNQS